MGGKLQRRGDYFKQRPGVKAYRTTQALNRCRVRELHSGIRADLGPFGAQMILNYQFFFPRMKKELPSGIGMIFSLGPENSGFNGATPTVKYKENKKCIRDS